MASASSLPMSSRLGSTSSSSGLTPIPAPTSRNNPISLRIYKAISTSFDDPASQEALQIASSFYSGDRGLNLRTSLKGKGRAEQNGHGPLQEEEEDEASGEVLGEESDWANGRRAAKGESAAMARKWLKKDIEGRLAGGSQRFLDAFGQVDQKLDVLRQHMTEMQERCDQVQAELDQANTGTRHLLERADGLRSQRASAQLRATIITLFLTRFTLSEQERQALTSRDVTLGQPVFQALDRVEVIRRDCKALLTGEEEKMQAGLDIMAMTSEQMENGYKKIHRWCQFEFRQYTREGQLEVSPVIREAVKRLRRRPGLLTDALQTLTSTRQSSLLNSFLDALTKGGPNGLPRPIELHAHDPTRYVGDMLAWIHQTTASEHEFLESLFAVKETKRMVGSERRNEDMSEEEAMVREAMDKDLEGLGRPLKMRIQQTIKSQEGIIMAYKISNLLQFYLVTMKKTIGDSALLTKTLQEIYDQSYAAFLETLDAQGRSMLRFLHPPDNNLTPPLALRDACQILREIISVYDSSLVEAVNKPSQMINGSAADSVKAPAEESDFTKLLSRAIDPPIEMCEKVSELRKGATDWEKDIFLINCLGYIRTMLNDVEGADAKRAELDEKIQGYVESMTYEHHGKLLEQCGLAPVMRTIRNRPADTPLSRIPETSAKAITKALSTFTTFISSIDVLRSPRLNLLQSTRISERIHRTALSKISEAYAEISDRVLDKKEGYEFAETLLRRSKEEVAVALGVDEGP